MLLLFPGTILVYMLTKGLVSLLQPSFVAAYIADRYRGWARATVFGANSAADQLASVFGLLVRNWTTQQCSIFSLVCATILVPYAFFLLPESMDSRQKRKFSCSTLENPFAPFKMLAKSKTVMACTGVLMCFVFASVGTGEVIIYYLNQRTGVNKDDLAFMYLESGILGPLVLFIALPILMRLLTPVLVLVVTLTAQVGGLILLASIWAKWPIYAIGVPLLSLTQMGAPTILAIMSSAGAPSLQGQRLTAVTATTQLATALGALTFGLLYGNLPPTLGFLPFLVATVFVVPAGFLAFRLPRYSKEDAERQQRNEIAAAQISDPASLIPTCSSLSN